MIGPNDEALAVMDGLRERGLWVPAIRPPTVPEGTARLRIALSAAHSEADVDRLIQALAELAPKSQPGAPVRTARTHPCLRTNPPFNWRPRCPLSLNNPSPCTARRAPVADPVAPAAAPRWRVEDVQALFELPFPELLYRAQTVHRANFDPTLVEFATLLSVKTGGCPEDCGYCPQAARYDTGVEAPS